MGARGRMETRSSCCRLDLDSSNHGPTDNESNASSVAASTTTPSSTEPTAALKPAALKKKLTSLTLQAPVLTTSYSKQAAVVTIQPKATTAAAPAMAMSEAAAKKEELVSALGAELEKKPALKKKLTSLTLQAPVLTSSYSKQAAVVSQPVEVKQLIQKD